MYKEDLLKKLRKNTTLQFDMPKTTVKGITYPDVVKQYINMCETVGCKVIEAKKNDDLNAIIRKAYPNAKVFASNVKGIEADRNPDTVGSAQELNGTDVGIIEGDVAVAENGKAICFISEELVILVHRDKIVNNMHEAYERITMPEYGYGCFISGPSKTADIEQALVMGAQAARGVTIILIG